MDWKPELVVVLVSYVDRAKHFYSEQVGCRSLLSLHWGAMRVPSRPKCLAWGKTGPRCNAKPLR